MADKIKIKPYDGADFKEIEVSTKNWNLETRKLINRVFRKGIQEKNGYCFFDAACEIIDCCTTLTEDEIFKLSKEEIETIAVRVSDEINKKK